MKEGKTVNACLLERKHFDTLLDALKVRGYKIIGPIVKDNAIVLEPVESVTQLPIGWVDEQSNGVYRLRKTDTPTLFNFTVGPHSLKQYLFPSVQKIFMTQRQGKSTESTVDEKVERKKKYAFIGLRPCELAALHIHDMVFIGGMYSDPVYQVRRKDLFLIVVNCTRAGGTCFCASMKTGPRAERGYDIAITEVYEKNQHYFILEGGSDRGMSLLKELKQGKEIDGRVQKVQELYTKAVQEMGKAVETSKLKDILAQQLEHPEYDNVGNRCLSCANCTLVCPTCFCSTVEDVTELSGASADRIRKWDSCFTLDFSYIHGGPVRLSVKSRYRQWLVHKFSTWIDQFGTFGCVGCGRCITWCPVGIDITEEIVKIRG
ncbi:MAG: 4Fe-4S dicluster domain-containing protein [Bacteroidetes bacterium]|nr:4Fe-4S dicluster domain-containing protein [Bacteroidota bacterium]